MDLRYEDYKLILSTIETEEGIEYIAEYREFEFCGGSGKNPNEAVDEAKNNLKIYIDELQELGKEIPMPIQELDYSGRFTLRISKGMHKKAAECAEREGISLNSFISEAVSEKVGNSAANPVLRKLDETVDKFVDVIYFSKPVLDTAVFLTKINSQTVNRAGYRKTPLLS